MKTEHWISLATFFVTLFVTLGITWYSTSIQIAHSRDSLLSQRIDSLKDLLEKANKTEEYSDVLIDIDINYIKGNFSESERLIDDINLEEIEKSFGMAPDAITIILVLIICAFIGAFIKMNSEKKRQRAK